MDNKLITSISPHVFASKDTKHIMLDVIIALIPAAIAATLIFGLLALTLIFICIATCVLSEYLYDRLVGKENTAGDLSAVVTGLLLALNLPSTLPIWQAVVGSFAAIVVVKCLFGGIGYNFANPAITGRIILLIAFTDTMTAAVMPNGLLKSVDAVSSATPLYLLEHGEPVGVSLLDMFLGIRAGALGETSALALILGGIYLLAKKVITWHTPVAFIATTFIFSLLVTGNVELSLYYLLSGGLFIGAIFMATDYVTTPGTPKGRLVFGIGCGIITCLIRFWGSYPEGVSFSILLMNILTPYIDKWTALKPFGGDAK